MERLIERGLMFGNLIPVSTPALVQRYNTALKKLTGLHTNLSRFHIDLSGYSPEIGEELGDPLYLNPNGCNRLFILLSPEQKLSPLLNAHFSTTRSILRRFYNENAAQLFALTVRDAVCGELMNSVFRLDRPADVLGIRTITVDADTVDGHIQAAGKLNGLIDRFTTKQDSWWDEQLIGEMIVLAKRTGDIRRHPLQLGTTAFQQGNFQTTHFGGLYVFHDLREPGVLRVDPQAAPGQFPIETVIDFDDAEEVAEFLEENRLVESIFEAQGLDPVALLRQRLDFMLIDHLAQSGNDLEGLTRQDLRRVARRYFPDLPDAFRALVDVLGWVEQGKRRLDLDAENPAWFYTIRSRPHADRDLVNMLLAHLTPLDVRQLFICHKTAFYDAYKSWSEAKRAYVVEFLAREYMVDKEGTRAALFGPEPAMQEPDIAIGPEIGPKNGPWGPRRDR